MKHVILFLAIVLSGCGARDMNTFKSPPATQQDQASVQFTVDLNRAFVRDNSSLGAGSAAMWIIVGPFNNNIIHLHGMPSGDHDGISAAPWRKRLKWGLNSFWTVAPKNTSITLRLRSGGTRSGNVDLGKIKIGEADNQTFSVTLNESGAQIAKN